MTIATRPESASTALALHDPLGTALGKMIAPYRAQLAPYLRDGTTLERVAAELVLASRRTPNLDKCEPMVLVDAVCRALDTGGIIGKDVFIVPFKDGKTGQFEPSVMTHYKFEAKLVLATGAARSIQEACVYDDELATFQVIGGTDPAIIHHPAIAPKAGRQLVGAYAVVNIGFNHRPIFKWLPLAKLEARRARSKEWNPTKVKACPEWWACKTAIREAVKLFPDNPKLAGLLARYAKDEEAEYGADLDSIPEAEPALGERPATVDENGVDLEYDGDAPSIAQPQAVDQDVAWAMAYILPGKPEAWGGRGGQPLGGLTTGKLKVVAKWAAAQAAQPDGMEKAGELEAAATIVLQTRQAEAADEISDAERTFGKGNLGPVLPGEVEAVNQAAGELPLGDAPTKSEMRRNAVLEGR